MKQRSTEKELLDLPGISSKDLNQNLKELETINTLLGGHLATFVGLNKLLKNHPKSQIIRIIDVGCGGGDSLREIAKFGLKNGYKFELVGLDLLEKAIQYAQEVCKDYDNISFVIADFREFKEYQKYDIAICSLFTHHLYGEDLNDLLRVFTKTKMGAVINDIHRHPLAYYSIKWLTSIFSKSYLVKNDAAVSVSKSFLASEWREILHENGIRKYNIKWIWAFRHMICIYND